MKPKIRVEWEDHIEIYASDKQSAEKYMHGKADYETTIEKPHKKYAGLYLFRILSRKEILEARTKKAMNAKSPEQRKAIMLGFKNKHEYHKATKKFDR